MGEHAATIQPRGQPPPTMHVPRAISLATLLAGTWQYLSTLQHAHARQCVTHASPATNPRQIRLCGQRHEQR